MLIEPNEKHAFEHVIASSCYPQNALGNPYVSEAALRWIPAIASGIISLCYGEQIGCSRYIPVFLQAQNVGKTGNAKIVCAS